jgi:hypothetical protein
MDRQIDTPATSEAQIQQPMDNLWVSHEEFPSDPRILIGSIHVLFFFPFFFQNTSATDLLLYF